MPQFNEADLRSDVLACLSFINANLPRQDWVKVLTGLKGSGLLDAEQIAQEWSQNGESFNQQQFNTTWRSLNYSGLDNPKGFLFSVGKQHGFDVKGMKNHGQEKEIRTKPALKVVRSYTQPEEVKAAFDAFSVYSGSDYLGNVKGVDGLINPAIAKQLRTQERSKYKNLIIPCYSIETGETTSYQTIFSTGDKRHMEGGKVSGTWFPFGSTDSNIFFLFESFVDALVAFDTMKQDVLCACIFGASSFKTAIDLIKTKYPDAKLVFFCDGDEAGRKVYQGCESMEGIAGYMSPDYGGSTKDAYDLWKKDKGSFTNELQAIVSDLKKKIDLHEGVTDKTQISLANIPCSTNKAHEVDGRLYMSGFTLVYVTVDGKGKKWVTLFEAMRRHEKDFFTCPVTGATASMHPNGFFSFGLKETVNAVPVAPNDVAGFVDRLNVFKGLKNTKCRVARVKKEKNADDLMAFIFLVKYRIDADIFIEEHSDKTCVTIGSNRFTIPPNTILSYWMQCISNVRHRVGSGGSGAIREDFKQIEIQRGKDLFPVWTPEILDAIQKAKVVVLNMPHGTGKTSKGIPAFLKGSVQSVLICHRVSLVGQLAEETKASHYNEDWRFIASGAAQCLASCIDSLVKPRNLSHAKQSGHIVIDEFTQVLKHVAGGGAKKSDTDKEKNATSMNGALREVLPGKRILLMDADTDNHSINTVLGLSGYTIEDVLVVNLPDIDLGYVADVRCTALNDGGKTTIAEAKKALQAGERIVIACESEKHARKINAALGGYKTKLIHGKIDDREKDAFINDPVNQSAQYQCVVYTSVLGTGFSVKHKRLSDQFTKCFYIGFGAIQSSQDAIQMIRRFRDVKHFHFQVLLRPDHMTHRHYKPLEKSGDPLERLQNYYTYNHGLNVTHFASELVLLLKMRKFTVNRPDLIDESLLDDIKIISTEELRAIDENALVNAKELSAIEFELLSKKTFKTCDEQAQIARYQCIEFYGTIDQARRYVAPKYHHQDRRLLHLMRADDDSLLGRYRNLLLNNAVIKKADASQIVAFVTDNMEELINCKVLPAKWVYRARVPTERVVQSIKTALAEFGINGSTCGDKNHPRIEVTWESFQSGLLEANKVDYRPVETREQVVMRLKSEGMTYEQIAQTIDVSRRTVASIAKRMKESAKTHT